LKKWLVWLVAGILLFSLALLSEGVVQPSAKAQTLSPRAYFPLMFKAEPVRVDDFEDQDPVWTTYYVKNDPKDGRFEYHFGRLTGYIDDNSAWVVGSPGWRPLGDFTLEVDARFSKGEYVNTLGLVFGGSSDFKELYEFALSYGSAQHQWGVRRRNADGTLYKLDDFDGVPSFVGWYSDWNHLQVIRIKDRIQVRINGRIMPGIPNDGWYIDGTYGTNRQVGVSIGSWELNGGEMEFDNFKLTPLSMPY
jgi:hypothetical protein